MSALRGAGPARRFGGLVSTGLLLVACSAEPEATPPPACPTEGPTSTSAQATLEGVTGARMTVRGSAEGTIEMELYPEEAPLATANFVALARCGFYEGISFHRVLAGFVIQAGDPQTRQQEGDFPGLGTGGPGYQFEIEPPAEGLAYEPYSVSMANDGRGNGSQFFVALVDLDQQLRSVGVYTIFGQVTEGTEVVDAIAALPVGDPQVGVPRATVRIDRIEILGPEEETGG